MFRFYFRKIRRVNITFTHSIEAKWLLVLDLNMRGFRKIQNFSVAPKYRYRHEIYPPYYETIQLNSWNTEENGQKRSIRSKNFIKSVRNKIRFKLSWLNCVLSLFTHQFMCIMLSFTHSAVRSHNHAATLRWFLILCVSHSRCLCSCYEWTEWKRVRRNKQNSYFENYNYSRLFWQKSAFFS